MKKFCNNFGQRVREILLDVREGLMLSEFKRKVVSDVNSISFVVKVYNLMVGNNCNVSELDWTKDCYEISLELKLVGEFEVSEAVRRWILENWWI